MISCSDYEQVKNKCRHMVGALPAPWIVNPKNPEANSPEVNTAVNKIGLQRFTKFLATSFNASNVSITENCIEDVIKLLKNRLLQVKVIPITASCFLWLANHGIK